MKIRTLLASAAILALCATAAFADEDTVSTVSEDGDVAIMLSGEVWQCRDGSTFTGWENDDVTITDGGRIIDHDSGDTCDDAVRLN